MKLISIKKTVLTIILIAVIVANIFTSCKNENSQKIKVGYLPMVSSLTHFVAIEKGF